MTPPEGVLDTTGMWDSARSFPEQVEQAAAASSYIGLPAQEDIENVVVLGMGGSGIAGDIMTAVAGPFMAVPIVVTKSYEPPSFVGPSTLCFALSFSGDTRRRSKPRRSPRSPALAWSSWPRGVSSRSSPQSWDATLIGLPDGIPYPRAALGAMTVPTLLVSNKSGCSQEHGAGSISPSSS